MENPSHPYDIHMLTEACGLMRLDPDYSRGTCDLSDDDDHDDPLGVPEITVKINDDWTVSPEESFVAFEDDLGEDSAQGDDEVNADNNDDNLVTSFFNEIRKFSSRRKSSSDDEEHVVPSMPTKVSRLMLDKEFTLSENEEELDSKEETEEQREEEREKESENADAGFGKESAHRHDVQKETGDRSNPQPP